MKRAQKRLKTNDLQELSPNLLSKILARVSGLEESQGRVTELQSRVATLEARVTKLERELIQAEDREDDMSRTILAARNGYTSILAERLARGADPNQDDGHGGTCLVASACYANPECTRLLIEYGADVTYAYSGDNASILYMLALVFSDREESLYQEGDYVLSADLLLDAGAPIDEVQGAGQTAMSVLLEMQAFPEESKRGRERRRLMQVLERQYWGEYETNPFFQASTDEAALLLLQGAANNDEGRVDITRVRSIRPDMRNDVVKALVQHQGMRETFVHIMLTMRNDESVSPFCALHGHESTVLSVIASFAGSSGWSLRQLQEAKAVLEVVEERFNEDRRGDDDEDSNDGADEDNSDDSSEGTGESSNVDD